MLHPHNLQLVSHLCDLPLHLTVLLFLLTALLYLLALLLFLHNDIRFIRKTLHKEDTLVAPVFNMGFRTFKVVGSLTFHRFGGGSSLFLVLGIEGKARVRGFIVKTLFVILELVS